MTCDSPSKDSNDWHHLTSLRRNLAFGNRVSLQHHQWNYIMGAGQLAKTTAIKKHYRGLGRAVGRSQIQGDLKGYEINK
jgi:hypothetical protein